MYDTNPIVIHLPDINANRNKIWAELRKSARYNSDQPANTSIITFNNYNRGVGVLEHNLDDNYIKYIVLGKKELNWTNRLKINLLLNYLNHCHDKYLIVLDCFDVILLDSPSKVLERFLEMNCKLLFNATMVDYPLCEPYAIIEKQILPDGVFIHPNSGCFVGEVDFCRKFYEEALDYTDEFTESNTYSDQIKIRPIYHKYYPEVKIDHKSKIFQVLFCDKNSNLRIEQVVGIVPPALL
jgi:hypothetical protein